MMTRESRPKREQIQIMSLDDLAPQDHLVRKLEAAVEWNFIYELVEEKYSADSGRPSIDPVVLIKLPVIQYMFGLRSMRQTIREAEVNTAYRWFLGLDIQDPIPHFSTFGKNYSRRFKDTDLFEQVFQHILKECFKAGLWTLFLYEKGLFRIDGALDGETIYDGCNCGNCHMTILSGGAVYACRRMESKVGRALANDLYDLFTGDTYEQYRQYDKFEKCAECELLRFCRGCPTVAAGYHGNMYAPDPQCWKEAIMSITKGWSDE